MYRIKKTFTADVAHRIHCQYLPSDFTCKCKGLHGHTVSIIVEVEAEDLTPNGMVLDYTLFSAFKKMLDRWIDHRTIVFLEDTLLFNKLVGELYNSMNLGTENPSKIDGFSVIRKFTGELAAGTVETISFDDPVLPARVMNMERYTPIGNDWEIERRVTTTNFATTAENFSRFFYTALNNYVGLIDQEYKSSTLRICSVEYKETPKTSAIFSI
jgi:6-pyruvoyl-tetrahydropterin synthase